MRTGSRWRWFWLVLSVPAISAGLWVAWMGEGVYAFLRDHQGNYDNLQWRVIVACRVIAWAAGVMAVLQAVSCVRMFVRGRDERPARLKHVWVGLVTLTTLAVCWGSQMLPIVSLMRGLRRPG